ncbi:hypothetical protein AVEN_170398-1 [Araneus ventricosus]|uniref:Uncharacterized protein n=1 Tax=Araneus ventricosus TaxID=182803 RepID=A0A4Y2N6T3_ARAVE|nr:hypothetical protein AVEN_170398-1 [Araneus ventricosus]
MAGDGYKDSGISTRVIAVTVFISPRMPWQDRGGHFVLYKKFLGADKLPGHLFASNSVTALRALDLLPSSAFEIQAAKE